MDQQKGSCAMQGMHTGRLRRSKTRRRAGFTALLAVLAFLAGCATRGDMTPAPDPRTPPEAKGSAVSRLADGREGFIIAEVARLNAASRRDFESAVAMLDEQAYEKAIDLLEKVIAQSPGVTAPYINLGIAYQRLDKPEQAEVQFKTALKLIPGHPVACNQYGLLMRKGGRFDEARKIYEQALAGFPDYYPVNRNLGILCDLYLNDLECALAHYETYNRAMPEDAQVKLWIADLRARLGLQ
jgi:Tfp pilus assembly protein PilF